MPKIYDRTENGTTNRVSLREGLDEINHAQMGGKCDVRTMSSISRTDYAIEYKDGRSVRLVQVDEPEPEPDVHVISYGGGKVHTLMPGMEDKPYPLCRGGGMNQMITKFHTTPLPLSCAHCVEYARRRAAKAEQDR